MTLRPDAGNPVNPRQLGHIVFELVNGVFDLNVGDLRGRYFAFNGERSPIVDTHVERLKPATCTTQHDGKDETDTPHGNLYCHERQPCPRESGTFLDALECRCEAER